MTRRSLNTKRRLELFNAHRGICHICAGKIQVGEAWEVEHIIPFAMGGEDGGDNLAPAHIKCHSVKTKEDVKNVAKAKRREAKHLGIKAERGPAIPGSKRSGWKRKLDGTIVRR